MALINVDVHIHTENAKELKDILLFIKNQNIKIMATQAELEQQLTDIGTQLDKVFGEIQDEIQKLEDAIAAGGITTPGVDAALAALKAKVQNLDDLNPDATV